MKRGGGIVFVIAVWAALAGSATAQCPASPAPLQVTSAATKSYVDRYNALLAGNPYLYGDSMAAGWRTLNGDMTRDPTVPVEMKAWAAIMLAGSLQEENDVAEALTIAQGALHLADAGGLDATPLHAEIMMILTLKEDNAGKIADAAVHAEKAIVETKRLYGEHSWAHGRAFWVAGVAANAVGRYEEAERNMAAAETLASVCLPPQAPPVEQMIRNHASILGTLGRLDESLGEIERAMAWTMNYAREDGPEIPVLLSTYGWTLRNAGRLREAEAVLRRSVDLYARYQANDWSSRANTTGKLANVLAAEGRDLEAEALWLKTHAHAESLKMVIKALANRIRLEVPFSVHKRL